MPKSKKQKEANLVVRGYKGFDKDLRCSGHQFEVGKTYEEKPPASLCYKGFHFCEYPLDIFNYYPPAGSRYCEVESDCPSEEKSGDTTRVTTKISIGEEINIAELVQGAVEYTWSRTTIENGQSTSRRRGAAKASGDQGAAQASGDQGAAQASGDQGAAQASGDQGAAQTSGDLGAAQASGYQGAAQASGYQGAAQASGDQGAAQASGDRGAAQASGDRGAAQASGTRGAAQASGTRGAAQASGTRGAAQASGDQGAAQASGTYSVALAAGYESMAMGELGCAICCVERDEDDYHIKSIKSAIVDGKNIKPGVWYTVRGGKFVIVE